MAPRSPEQFAEIREERKAQILEAALEVFAKHSFQGASISEVAIKANVSKGLIYNYFKSKEEILKVIIHDLFDELVEKMQIDSNQAMTREDFVSFIDISIDEVVANPDRWKLYMSLSLQPAVTPLLMEEMMPKVQPLLTRLNNYFMEQGHDDPLAMMRYYSAIMDGVQMHILLDPENFPVEKVKQMMIDQFA
ncbi:MAG: TetR/AcrR family transcriptional regulator [Flavobacteriales bacterium]|jgi:AcrR family transcriptional regulator|nr:TetR/AcrR family transcriptional regulator [Flavobacteriales bacterium]